MPEFTKEQLEAYQRYESVQESGKYNMFDSRARELTGLSREDYSFVMENFTELCDAVAATKSE